jgi:hypothetical protein
LVADLIDSCNNESDSEVRERAVNSLGFLVDKNEVPLIYKCISNNDYNVFMMIMEHLSYLPIW